MRVTQMPATAEKKNSSTVPYVMPRSGIVTKHNAIDIKKILSEFEKDDYILAGLIIVLMLEGCDDYILLAALGYLFIMGFKG